MPTAPRRRCPACLQLVAGACPNCDAPAAPLATLANVTLVTGPPCSGKNTYVRQHAQPGDLIVDLDALLVALTGRLSHDHDEQVKPYAFAARDAVLAQLWGGQVPVRAAWVVLGAPTEFQRRQYRAQVGSVVMLWATPATLHARAAAERPPEWAAYIDRWLARYDTVGVDEVVDTTPTDPQKTPQTALNAPR